MLKPSVHMAILQDENSSNTNFFGGVETSGFKERNETKPLLFDMNGEWSGVENQLPIENAASRVVNN